MGPISIHTLGQTDGVDAEGQAWVLLAVIAAVIVALLGLIFITVIRYVSRRSQARLDKKRPEDGGSTSGSPWSEAGKRAEPLESSDLGDGDAHDR